MSVENIPTWIDRYTGAVTERQELLHRARQLGQAASVAAQQWLYGEIPSAEPDISMINVSFSDFVTQFIIIIQATLMPIRPNEYKMKDIQTELEQIAGSQHVARQLFNKLLDENVILINDHGYVLLSSASQVPSQRTVDDGIADKSIPKKPLTYLL